MDSHVTRGGARDDRVAIPMPGRNCGRTTTATFGSTEDPWAWAEAREDGEEPRDRRLQRAMSPPCWSPSTPRAGCPTRWTALEHLQDRPHPADRDRQRQLRRHPRPARACPGPGRHRRGVLRASAASASAPPSSPRSARIGRAATRIPRTARRGAPSRPMTATGSGCCTTMRCRRRTRCTDCSPMCHRPDHRHHRTQAAAAQAPRTAASRSARSASASPAPAAGNSPRHRRDRPGPARSAQTRLGVSTCGMLVRTAVWQDLDGLDPALPVFRDGVEFGWRAHLHGYRVVTTPDAEVIHRQVGRAGLRPRGLPAAGPARSTGSSAWSSSPVTPPARAAAGLAPAGLSCLLPRRRVPDRQGARPRARRDPGPRLLRRPPRPDPAICAPGRRRSIPCPGTDEVVHSLRPPWWSSLRVAAEALRGAAVGALPLGGRRRRGRLARRADRRRLQLGRRRAAAATRG